MALWSKSSGEDVINIGKGHPNPAYLPAEEVTAAFAKALSPEGNGASLLQYGRMQGNEDFCIAICEWLRAKASRKKISPEEILITTGSGHGLALCCQLYSCPGDVRFRILFAAHLMLLTHLRWNEDDFRGLASLFPEFLHVP